jgi:hypothetical protein
MVEVQGDPLINKDSVMAYGMLNPYRTISFPEVNDYLEYGMTPLQDMGLPGN